MATWRSYSSPRSRTPQHVPEHQAHRSRPEKPPYFTDAERAVLALSEPAHTKPRSRGPVTDEISEEAARHYDERGSRR